MGLEYLVKWQDYDIAEATWLPEKQLLPVCEAYIAAYMENIKPESEPDDKTFTAEERAKIFQIVQEMHLVCHI